MNIDRLKLKYKDLLMSNLEQGVKEKTNKLEELLKDLDTEHDQLMDQVYKTETFLEREDEKIADSVEDGNKIVLKSLRELYNDIRELADEDVEQWSLELWRSLQEFEQLIMQEQRGYQIEYERLNQKYIIHTTSMKQKSTFYISALESALIQTKQKYKREIERLNMNLADIESKQLNRTMEDNKVQQEIEKFETGKTVINNVRESRVIINNFVNIIKCKVNEQLQLKSQLDELSNIQQTYDQNLAERQKLFIEERNLRQYYQKIVLKVARDLKLFDSHDEDKKLKFEQVYENDNDLNYQRQVKFILEHIELQKCFDQHVNKYFGVLNGLEKVNLNLLDIGIIPPDKQEGEKSSEYSSHSSLNSSENDLLSLISEEDKIDERVNKNLKPVRRPSESSKRMSITSSRRSSRRQSLSNSLSFSNFKGSSLQNPAKQPKFPANLQMSPQKIKKQSLSQKKTSLVIQFDSSDKTQGILQKQGVNKMTSKIQNQVTSKKFQQNRKSIRIGAPSNQKAIQQEPTENTQAKYNWFIKKEVCKKIKTLIHDAKQGLLEDPIATEQSGKCPIKEEDFSRKMIQEWILQLNPELAKDFRQKDLKGTFGDEKDKKKKRKKNKSIMNENAQIDQSKSTSGRRQKSRLKKNAKPLSTQQMFQLKSAQMVQRKQSIRSDKFIEKQEESKSQNQQSRYNFQKPRRLSIEPAKHQQMVNDIIEATKNSTKKNINKYKKMDSILGSPMPGDQLSSISSNESQDSELASSIDEESSSSSSYGNSQTSEIHSDSIVTTEKQTQDLQKNKTLSQSSNVEQIEVSLKSKQKYHSHINSNQTIKNTDEQSSSKQKLQSSQVSEDVKAHKLLENLSFSNQVIELEIVAEATKKIILSSPQKLSQQQIMQKSNYQKTNITIGYNTDIEELNDQDEIFEQVDETQDQMFSINRGVALIDELLQKLKQKKYWKLLEDVEHAILSNEPTKGSYLLTKKDVDQLQSQLLNPLGLQLTQEQMNNIENQNIEKLFEILNHKIRYQNWFYPHINAMEADGVDMEHDMKLSKMNAVQKIVHKKKEQEKLRKVPFGNLYRPIFSAKGEIKGIEFHSELAPIMFREHGSQKLIVQRAIKACLFINQLLQNGHEQDFVLYSSQDPKMVNQIQKKDKIIQVDVVELRNNYQTMNLDMLKLDPGEILLNSMKNHVAWMLGRQATAVADQHKRALRFLDLQEFAEYIMENVMTNNQNLKYKKKISVSDYMKQIFLNIQDQVQLMRDDNKQMMNIDDLIILNPKYISSKFRSNQEVQTEIYTQNRHTNTNTDYFAAYSEHSKALVRARLNQMTIDKSIQREFENTLDLFDQFVNQFDGKIDIRHLKDAHLAKVQRQGLAENQYRQKSPQSIHDDESRQPSQEDPQKANRIVAFSSFSNQKKTEQAQFDYQIKDNIEQKQNMEQVFVLQSKIRNSYLQISDSNFSKNFSREESYIPTNSDLFNDQDLQSYVQRECKNADDLFPRISKIDDKSKLQSNQKDSRIKKKYQKENQRNQNNSHLNKNEIAPIVKQMQPIPILGIEKRELGSDLKELQMEKYEQTSKCMEPKLSKPQQSTFQKSGFKQSKIIKPLIQKKQTVNVIDVKNTNSQYANLDQKSNLQKQDKQKPMLTDRQNYIEKDSIQVKSPADTPDDISTFMKSAMGSRTIDNINTQCLTSQRSSNASPELSFHNGRTSAQVNRCNPRMTQFDQKIENNTIDRRKIFGIMTPPDPNTSTLAIIGRKRDLADSIMAANGIAIKAPIDMSRNEQINQSEFLNDQMMKSIDISRYPRAIDKSKSNMDNFLRSTFSPQGKRHPALISPKYQNVPPAILNNAIDVRRSINEKPNNNQILNRRPKVQTSLSINSKVSQNWHESALRNYKTDAMNDKLRSSTQQQRLPHNLNNVQLRINESLAINNLQLTKKEVMQKMFDKAKQSGPLNRSVQDRQEFEAFKKYAQNKLEKISKKDGQIGNYINEDDIEIKLHLKQQNKHDLSNLQQNLQKIKIRDNHLKKNKAIKFQSNTTQVSPQYKKNIDSKMHNIDQLLSEFKKNEQSIRNQTLSKIKDLLNQKNDLFAESQNKFAKKQAKLKQLQSLDFDDNLRPFDQEFSFDFDLAVLNERLDQENYDNVSKDLQEHQIHHQDSIMTAYLDKKRGDVASEHSSILNDRNNQKSP